MRRTGFTLLVAAMLLTLPACKNAKVGARCTPSEGAARNATHVLFCTNGRWKATLTIGQAADFITSTWPDRLESPNGVDLTVQAGGQIPSSWFRLTDRGGRGIEGATVTVTAPTAGPGRAGIEFGGSSTDVTQPGGISHFGSLRVGGATGEFVLTASAPKPGGQVSVTVRIRVIADAAYDAVVVSGGGQVVAAGVRPQPIVVEFRDRYGNPVDSPVATLIDPDGELTGATVERNGARISVQPASSTSPDVHVAAVYAANSVFENGERVEPGVYLAWEVVPGPAATFTTWGSSQAAATLGEFQNLQVRVVDQYGNPTDAPGAVTWSVVDGPGGATGTVTPYVDEEVYGARVVAGLVQGPFTVHVEVEGMGSADFLLTVN